MKEFSERFREDYFEFKRKHSHTQQTISELVGCSRAAIASFESGRSPFPEGRTTLNLVAAIYPQVTRGALARNHKCLICEDLVPGPDTGAEYCVSCGGSLGWRCDCRYVNPSIAKFCGGCGSPVSTLAE